MAEQAIEWKVVIDGLWAIWGYNIEATDGIYFSDELYVIQAFDSYYRSDGSEQRLELF